MGSSKNNNNKSETETEKMPTTPQHRSDTYTVDITQHTRNAALTVSIGMVTSQYHVQRCIDCFVKISRRTKIRFGRGHQQTVPLHDI